MDTQLTGECPTCLGCGVVAVPARTSEAVDSETCRECEGTGEAAAQSEAA